jgi:hypothetical protein
MRGAAKPGPPRMIRALLRVRAPTDQLFGASAGAAGLVRMWCM